MIKIPCPSCGCQYCEAITITGEKVRIEICRCNDGSRQYEVSIIQNDESKTSHEKHQCSEKEIEQCLASRFKINLDTMNHKCFN